MAAKSSHLIRSKTNVCTYRQERSGTSAQFAIMKQHWKAITSAVAASAARIGSASIVYPAEVCFSNPLFAAQVQQVATTPWQSNPKESGGNATTTSSFTTTTDGLETEGDSSDDSSGGWSGPHACAGPYCVYSHKTFAAGRGLVLISDGDSANALANLPIIVELASPSAAQTLASTHTNMQTDGVVTKEIPGKGRGFVATRRIHRGEQIMAYTPALIVQRGFFDDDGEVSRTDLLGVLRDAISRLPTATRVAFWKQLGQTHQAGDDDIMDVIMNNSFNLPLTGSADTFIGNFPEVSMYNHDCRPSVAFHLDGGVVHRTQAVLGGQLGGGIAPGEELSISYVDSFRARSVRQARTQRNWGFSCACAQCRLPEALANASDHRLWRLYEVENALTLTPTTSASINSDQIELLLSLYAQERLLDSHGAAAYRTAALNYNGLKRRELAIKYALLALEAIVLEQGPRSGRVGEMVALLEDPEGHWSWGRMY